MTTSTPEQLVNIARLVEGASGLLISAYLRTRHMGDHLAHGLTNDQAEALQDQSDTIEDVVDQLNVFDFDPGFTSDADTISDARSPILVSDAVLQLTEARRQTDAWLASAQTDLSADVVARVRRGAAALSRAMDRLAVADLAASPV